MFNNVVVKLFSNIFISNILNTSYLTSAVASNNFSTPVASLLLHLLQSLYTYILYSSNNRSSFIFHSWLLFLLLNEYLKLSWTPTRVEIFIMFVSSEKLFRVQNWQLRFSTYDENVSKNSSTFFRCLTFFYQNMMQ